MNKLTSITVTTHRSINFGAVLQAYALQQFQKKQGITNTILDIPPRKKLYEKVKFRSGKKALIDIILNFLYFFHKKDSDHMLDNFHGFVKKNLKCTQIYQNIEELRKNPPKADFYINGSDQVFGIRGELDDIRMMQFGMKSIKKFSYAASLGEYDWNEKEKEIFAKEISEYRAVSVREIYAKKYLEGFLNLQCEVNIDPVFLLSQEDWNKVAVKSKIKKPYILCYPLIGNDKLQMILDELKKITGYEVVSVQTIPMKRVKADSYIFCAGPAEFLGLIEDAEAVVTTSFHGTALSILYEKPFYTLIKQYKSQRITDLLNMMNLSNRIYTGANENISLEVDFSYAAKIIKSEYEKSCTYFRKIVDICSE